MSDIEAAAKNAMAFMKCGFTVAEVTKAMEPIGPAIVKAWKICEQRYRLAGTPYGDTERGMIRWYREMYR